MRFSAATLVALTIAIASPLHASPVDEPDHDDARPASQLDDPGKARARLPDLPTTPAGILPKQVGLYERLRSLFARARTEPSVRAAREVFGACVDEDGKTSIAAPGGGAVETGWLTGDDGKALELRRFDRHGLRVLCYRLYEAPVDRAAGTPDAKPPAVGKPAPPEPAPATGREPAAQPPTLLAAAPAHEPDSARDPLAAKDKPPGDPGSARERATDGARERAPKDPAPARDPSSSRDPAARESFSPRELPPKDPAPAPRDAQASREPVPKRLPVETGAREPTVTTEDRGAKAFRAPVQAEGESPPAARGSSAVEPESSSAATGGASAATAVAVSQPGQDPGEPGTEPAAPAPDPAPLPPAKLSPRLGFLPESTPFQQSRPEEPARLASLDRPRAMGESRGAESRPARVPGAAPASSSAAASAARPDPRRETPQGRAAELSADPAPATSPSVAASPGEAADRRGKEGTVSNPFPLALLGTKQVGFYRAQVGDQVLWFQCDRNGLMHFLPQGVKGPRFDLRATFERAGRTFHLFVPPGGGDAGFLVGDDGSINIFRGDPFSRLASNKATYVAGLGFNLP